MVTAYPNRTAPVLRGAWILERILGTPPAPPPPNVEALPGERKPARSRRPCASAGACTARTRRCIACHGVMDPLGFALENFDAVGPVARQGSPDAGASIDSSGELPDGTPVNGPDDLRNALLASPTSSCRR